VAVLVLSSSAAADARGTSPRPDPLIPVPHSPLPASFEELPEGPPTTLPWWQDDRLHVSDTVIKTRFSRITSRPGTVVVGKDSTARFAKTQWYLVVGHQLKRLPTSGTTRMPKVSANGRWIVWLDEHATPIEEYVDDTR
jgi:hypothetical protein